MSEIIAVSRRHDQSPDHRRGAGPRAVQAAYRTKSAGAAQKRIQRDFGKAQATAQLLALQGVTAPVVNHVAALQNILAVGPAQEICSELLTDGRIDRSQDEARDLVIANPTPQGLDLLEARTRREICEKYALLRSILGQRGAA